LPVRCGSRCISEVEVKTRPEHVSRALTPLDLHLVGSCGRSGSWVPGRHSVAPVPRSSSRVDVQRSELSGRVARRLTVLYSAGRGAAGVWRDPCPHGLGQMW